MSRGIRQDQTRASGETTASEVAAEEHDKFDEGVEEEVLPEERERQFRTPGFSRMRINWRSDDWPIIQQAKAAVDGRILESFADAYQVMHDVYDLVRTPEVDPKTGEVKTDQWGLTIWHRTPSGSYEEDWSKLTEKEKENIMFSITTRMFEWEQRAADAWGEAMFAKAQWEERFSIDFNAPIHGTVDDRKAKGNIESREERYFAIFLTLYSRKADAIVRSLSLLGQRLKDSML